VIAIGIAFRMLMLKNYGRRDRTMDLGEVFVGIVLVYGLIPGVGFLLAENGFGVIKDSRLYGGYDVNQVEYIQLLFLLFLGSCACSYAVLRNVVPGKFDHRMQSKKLVFPVIMVTLILSIVLFFIGALWGADVGDAYISSYTKLRSAPVLIQQISGVGTQLQLSLAIAAVTLAVAAVPHKHYFVALALAVNMALVVVAGGSRMNAFLAFLAYVVAASMYVRTFNIRRAGILAIPALGLFLFAGLLRGDSDDIDILRIFFDSEFTGVFVTPLDLHILYPQGFSDDAPFNLYIVDLLRLLPSQIVPFEKIDPGAWYVGTFYSQYQALGGGFAFGLMAEIVLGVGIPEAIIRGMLLGSVFALIANRLHHTGSSQLNIVAFIWLMIISYQCYRDTNFSILARAFFHLLPVIALLSFIQSVRSKNNYAPQRRTI
jgi:hypothetical protein